MKDNIEWVSQYSTLPLEAAMLGKSKKVAELLKLDMCKRLHKDVCDHVFHWTIFE